MRMIRLKRQVECDCDYPSDAQRITRVLMEAGYMCNVAIAVEVWQAYSDSMCAGWIILPNSDAALLAMCEEVIEV